MTAGVSPVSPILRGTPANRIQYDATPLAPPVAKASAQVNADPPSPYDAENTTPRQPHDITSGINVMA
jgi:hypothetical protein